MKLIKPFQGLRPKAEFAQQVIAPPYDVLSTEEARELAKDNPYSFLHISKPEIDLPKDTNPFSDEVYAKGTENFQALITQNILQQDNEDCYYIYRISRGDHQQTGLVAVCSIEAYRANKIRKHELTRPDKETDRVRQMEALNAHTGPVMLSYRHEDAVDELITAPETSPEYSANGQYDSLHEIWVIKDKEHIQQISDAVNNLDCLFIADGHHRSAAAARVDGSDAFLSVIFPDNHLNILSYNRVIKDLNGLDEQSLLEKLNHDFTVVESDDAVQPENKFQIGMFTNGHWYKLTANSQADEADPVDSLTVSLLGNKIIEPIFAITDQRKDPRINFVGGSRGLSELEKCVNSGDYAVAFSLYPTAMTELENVAEANLLMPPKSTWFDPKLADGLVSYLL